MFRSYREIFQTPGTKGFSAAGFIARMPISMMGIGIVTMLSQLRGEYWLAGAVAATFALASALLAPHISRLADRLGQSRVLLPAAGISVTAAAILLLCTRLGAPDWTLFLAALFAGGMPNMAAMVRARWAAILGGSPKLHTAFSFESVVDEICFIVGPIVSVSLSVAVFPEAGPLLSCLFLLTGVVLFTLQKGTEPKVRPIDPEEKGSVIKLGSLQALVFTLAAMGVIFGAVDVVTVAFAEEQGNKVAASIVLSIYAVGSCLAGLVYGTLSLKAPLYRQFLQAVALCMVMMLPLFLVSNLFSLAIVVFFAGLSVAPTMIVTMGLVEKIVPRSMVTEGMTWAITGLGIGVAFGSAAAGWVIDGFGSHAGFMVAIVAGVLAMLIAGLGYRSLRSAHIRAISRAEEAAVKHG
ncbi:MFS transporter [Brevibacillus parabrevis]|uniref:MFS transporter n=1 Tax=Brevibacillus parabrevis TaxID=54914 RepID=UPI001C2291F8|nr:MFS transporter [Brevibacillus parabrevis]MBU8716118.1 MFS transporter [Brevibacillus parabrevis]